MPRRKIQFAAGHYYHIYNRGNNRERIFFNADNYAYFLRQLKRYITDTDIVTYCLMPNHYHLILPRYIHLNPVRAGLVKKAEDWTWSSYQEYVGLREDEFLKPRAVLAHFYGSDSYRAFVEGSPGFTGKKHCHAEQSEASLAQIERNLRTRDSSLRSE